MAENQRTTWTSVHGTPWRLVEQATRRRSISAAQRVAELAGDVGRELETVRQRAEALVLGSASDTGTGKPAIAGQVALHVGEQHGPVVFVGMELTEVDLAVRFVSVLTNIPTERLVSGTLTAGESEQVPVLALEPTPRHSGEVRRWPSWRAGSAAAGTGGLPRRARAGRC